MMAITNILVATDFGPASETALRYGRELADRFGARLRILHVVENVLVAAATEYGYATIAPDIQRDLETAAARQADGLLTDEERRTHRATAVTVTATSPAAAIVGYAGREGVDLLVLGTHGRGALSHLFMGSVAERVVRTAGCPVLTVHHPEHEFVWPDAPALVAVAPEKADEAAARA